MFHKFVVKDTIETEGPKAQVYQLRSQGCHQPQAKNLTRGLMFRPRGWVNVWSEDMAVCKVQHMIHGSACKEGDTWAHSLEWLHNLDGNNSKHMQLEENCEEQYQIRFSCKLQS